MLRSIALASLVAPALLACARAPSQAASAPPPPEPLPYALSYRLMQTGDSGGVLLSGRADVDVHHGAHVKATAAHDSAEEDLFLSTKTRDDGTVLVEVSYEERSREGAVIRWSPAVRVARGGHAVAEVNGAGWGRTIDLTMQ
jgi:hypothetical protein